MSTCFQPRYDGTMRQVVFIVRNVLTGVEHAYSDEVTEVYI